MKRLVFGPIVCLVLSVMLLVLGLGSVTASPQDATYQPLPLAQDWSDGSLITTNDDWAGVAGIVGYRGDGLTTSTGADPQTVTADGTSTPVDVIAGSTSSSSSGGIHEIDGDVVALQGSGTADAPYLQVHLDTTGCASVQVAYTLNELDTNDAVQQVALHYRLGESGVFTNVASAYVADASDGASLSTPVSAVLPAGAGNQSQLQVRIMTTNAAGSDSMIGIDDIAVTCANSTPTLPILEGFDDCTLDGWSIVSLDTDTTNSWSCSESFSNISVNGFGGSAPAHDWLVLPTVDLDATENEVMEFRSYTRFTDGGTPHPPLSVQYSLDYTSVVTTANWITLTGFTYPAADLDAYVDSGAVDISGIAGDRVTFAFKYISSGTGSGTSSSWRVDEVELYELRPEPTHHTTHFTATVNGDDEITTTWTDSISGTQVPDSYLIYCRSGAVLAPPVDGTAVADDINCSDGSGAQNIDHGAGSSATWSGLSASTTYTFSIYPYTNSGDAIDFKTDGTVPTTTATTTALIPDACDTSGAADTCIHDVQGSSSASPLDGSSVTIEGIVVAVYADLDGFFVQEEDSDVDTDAATSEGVFVYMGSDPAVAEGDLVQVTGAVDEFFGMTQIDNDNTDLNVTVVSSGNGLPTPGSVDLPAAAGTDEEATFEHLEGMLVQFVDQLTVSEYYQLARYGHMVLTEGGKIYQYTHTDDTPTAAEYTTHQAEVASRRIFLDDGNNFENDSAADVFYPQPNGFSIDNYIRGGDTVDSLTGVMHWSWAGSGDTTWRIRPTTSNTITFNAENPRTTAPEDVGGGLVVATLNVLNFFTTIDNGTDDICGGNANLECRGADSAAELVRQTRKMTATLIAMDADVVGLVEIENNDSASLQAVVDGLNGTMGAGTYDFIDTGTIGTDAIKVGFIYKTAIISPTGRFEILDSGVDVRFDDSKNRPVLAQTFVEVSSGEKFTLAVNHLKSKGSSCGFGDDDTTTGQGNCNGTRTDGAAAMVDWLATDPTNSGDPDFMILGDLNAYAMEDPIQTIMAGADDTDATADDYTNLIAQFVGNDAYSFVFSGEWGYLDHALATSSLTDQVTGVTEWHVNSDEASLLDYNDGIEDAGEQSYEAKPGDNDLFAPDVYRNSDHDPLLVGLRLGDVVELEISSISPSNNSTDMAIDGLLTLTLTQAIQAGSGYITINTADGRAVVQTIAVTDTTAVTISGSTMTIDPPQDLSPNTTYYINMDTGALTDGSGNPIVGIIDNTSWVFTTGDAAPLIYLPVILR